MYRGYVMNRTILVAAILMFSIVVAPAQRTSSGQSQHTIDVPHPLNEIDVPHKAGGNKNPFSLYTDCPDRNAPLLEIIRLLSDDSSVQNEVKYETDNGLDVNAIFQRRMDVISKAIQTLRSRGVKK